MDERIHTITQKRFLRGSQQFTIEGHALKIERRRGLSLEQQCSDLHGFQPEPLRIKRVPLGRMLTLLIGLALTVLLVTWGIRTRHGNTFAMATAFGLVSAFVAFIAAIQTCFGFANVVVFQGGYRQIRLWHGLPDQTTFDRFVEALSKQIRQARESTHPLLLQMRVAGIINDQQYRQAVELFSRAGCASRAVPPSPGSEGDA
jgi:hypothetical protein